MINIEKAKLEFDNYTKKYALNEDALNRKYYHTYRVMKICEDIATYLNLREEEIKLAEIIGLLHDIGRFEQYTRFQTFSDSKSIDHGNYGVEILEKDNLIRKFNEDKINDKVILTAIKNHNKFEIEKNLKKEEEIFSKIIRDADKLDIFYEMVTIFYKNNSDEKEMLENSIITDDMVKNIEKRKPMLKNPELKILGSFLTCLCMVFDLNFKYSFEVLKKEDYINKTLNKFNFKDENTKNKIEEIRKILNDYIQEKG